MERIDGEKDEFSDSSGSVAQSRKRGMHLKECRAGVSSACLGTHRSLRRSMQSLCRVRAAWMPQGSWGSPSLAPQAGPSPLLLEPRLVLTGAEPIVLPGHGPLSSRNHWPGRAASSATARLPHTLSPGPRWKILNLYPETASCTTYCSQVFIIPPVDGDPDQYLIPGLPGSFGQSCQPTARVWSGSPHGPDGGPSSAHRAPPRACSGGLVFSGFDEEIHAFVIILTAGRITHLRSSKKLGPVSKMEKDETVSDCSPHIANIGRLVEDMENKIRSTLNEIYFGKTKDIVNGLRSVQTFADKSKQEALKNDLVEALKRKQQC
uniref:F-actin-capping protein subunit beta isoform X2 n=1 Tax=Halichoerus grypus TaxID=9711 RepID=UPI001659D50E|nr:F-actin-capping protein subunit beta isoform X2 [Halichoerus grypus]